jgi:hypothetical protein
MKTVRYSNYAKLFTFAAALLFAASCEKDDNEDITPDYVGTWVRTESVTEEGVTIEIKDIVSFTEYSFSNQGQLKNPGTGEWIDLLKLKASISVDGNAMDVTVHEIGMSDMDWDTGLPTGDILYFREGEAGFEEALAAVEVEENFDAEYSRSGNQLTLKSDDNNDGDFDDEGETVVYTRQ